MGGWLLAMGLLAGAAYAWYVWNKPARNVQHEEALAINAQALFDAFNTNEAQANQLYLNKAIAVTGNVAGLAKNKEGKTVVSLQTTDPMFGVQCTLLQPNSLPAVGATVTIKGICTGFLMDVILIDAYLQP